jgi:hypothetical protein
MASDPVTRMNPVGGGDVRHRRSVRVPWRLPDPRWDRSSPNGATRTIMPGDVPRSGSVGVTACDKATAFRDDGRVGGYRGP